MWQIKCDSTRRRTPWCVVFTSVIVLCLAAVPLAHAQQAPDEGDAGSLTVRGVVDTYYAWDFGDPQDNLRPPFLFNHNRHNEFSLNLALVQLEYDGPDVRSKVGFIAGTYPEYNYAAELELLRHVYQAWAGYQLLEGLWWDAGIFPSHLGFDSALALENPTLTRTLLAEGSPYYLAGTRLYWQPNPVWTLGVTLANGWQNIRETPDNDAKGGGLQITWQPLEEVLLNSSSWFSDEFPEHDSRWRLFHNFYGIFQLGSLVTLTAGVDTGIQQSAMGSADAWDFWWGAALIGRFDFTEQLGAALRVEYWSDPEAVVSTSGVAETPGLETLGVSANFDVRLADVIAVRTEGRMFYARDEIFSLGGDPSQLNVAAIVSLAADYSHRFF